MRNSVVLIICILILGLSEMTLAQSTTAKYKTYYYQDGSVFIGRPIGENDQQIELIISTGDTLHINKALLRHQQNKVKVPKSFYNKGFFGSFNIAFSSAGQFNFMGGYRINEKYSVGIGTGLHYYQLDQNGLFADNSFVPIYAYGRMYLTKSEKIKPFIGLAVGYSLPLTERFNFNQHEFTGGLMFQPEIGLHFAGRRKSSFYISIGQSFQNTSGSFQQTDSFFNPVFIDYKKWHSNTMLKFGIEFR